MKKLSHIYRQSFVLVRQRKDKTNTSRKDNLAWARQTISKGRKLQLPSKLKAWQKDNLRGARQFCEGARQM